MNFPSALDQNCVCSLYVHIIGIRSYEKKSGNLAKANIKDFLHFVLI